ncbi:glycosyltransferase family 2 protein [uncultured Abyssibacter sp.]|uniref:glycosyltransferase family 2 protein n=1 Tax=uncultured Abyssibacter sp. TaxID=2320202 RepID=UPI0032B10169
MTDRHESSVIISTYNQPDWLEKCLWGFAYQRDRRFEVVIADDGSRPETRQRAEAVCDHFDLPLNYVWHEDDGFQKCRILNKAILAARSDYLIFTDGDCIPKPDFIATHLSMRRPGHFLSGGYFKLPMSTSECIGEDDVASGRVFDGAWLRAHDVTAPWNKLLKITATPRQARWANRLTPANRSWNGNNSSTWRSLAIQVGGFDERMGYGGQDREFGERLMNAGIKPIMMRYSTGMLHLDHSRGYRNEEGIRKNRAIRAETRQSRRTVTEFGLNLHEATPPS